VLVFKHKIECSSMARRGSAKVPHIAYRTMRLPKPAVVIFLRAVNTQLKLGVKEMRSCPLELFFDFWREQRRDVKARHT